MQNSFFNKVLVRSSSISVLLTGFFWSLLIFLCLVIRFPEKKVYKTLRINLSSGLSDFSKEVGDNDSKEKILNDESQNGNSSFFSSLEKDNISLSEPLKRSEESFENNVKVPEVPVAVTKTIDPLTETLAKVKEQQKQEKEVAEVKVPDIKKAPEIKKTPEVKKITEVKKESNMKAKTSENKDSKSTSKTNSKQTTKKVELEEELMMPAPVVRKSNEERMAELNARKTSKTSVATGSNIESYNTGNSSVSGESTSSKVSTAKNSLQGVAASSYTPKKTGNGIKSLDSQTYTASGTDFMTGISLVTYTGSNKKAYAIKTLDGNRLFSSIEPPVILLSDEAMQSIKTEMKVTVSFRILENGRVEGSSIFVSGALLVNVKNEIKDQVRVWTFATGKVSKASFVYTLEPKG
ncbi:MAG: hypothetical protein K6F69_03165 [Treponema sp.]|nr:hypothetical protein [Treponema sp.]